MIAWYIVPYSTRYIGDTLTRYPAIDDYTSQITTAGGKWAEIEILGNRCIVKVKAMQIIQDQLDAVYKVIPVKSLDDSLPVGDRTAFKNELLDMGYSLAEVAKYYDGSAVPTFRNFIRVATKRRLAPRYNMDKTKIFVDGNPVKCNSIENINTQVTD